MNRSKRPVRLALSLSLFIRLLSLLMPLVLLAFSSAPTAAATEHAAETTGFGIILGEPTGFTVKHGLSKTNALDGGLAFSFSDFMMVYGDYLWEFPGLFSGSKGPKHAPSFAREITPYLGLGGALFLSTNSAGTKFYSGSGSSAGFGLRIPVGAEWRPATPPIGVYVELAPGVGIAPSTFGFFQGGVGARYYF